MVLTRLSSTHATRFQQKQHEQNQTAVPSHHPPHAASAYAAAPADAHELEYPQRGLSQLDRPASPLFGAAYPTTHLHSVPSHDLGYPQHKPSDADAAAFNQYFSQYDAGVPSTHDAHSIPVHDAAMAQKVAGAWPNSAPPLVPFGGFEPAAGHFPAASPAFYGQPQARALAFDQELASPLFDTDDYLSPYINGLNATDDFGSADASTSTAMTWPHAVATQEWSPVLSDISPTLTVAGDFTTGEHSGSTSPSPLARDLALFSDLSVRTPNQAAGASSAPMYSPVISPTELADHEISPPTMLPPPLPLISSTLAATVPRVQADFAAPRPAVQKEVENEPEMIAPATPPAEADDFDDDPDFDPSAATRSTRSSTGARRRTTRGVTRGVSSSPAPATSLRITDPSAPVQDRKYQIESRTSAKPIPKNLAARRAKKLARGESVPSESEAVSEAAKRRQANTLAARESRKRKADYLAGLEERVVVQAEELEELRAENQRLRSENARLLASGGVFTVKTEEAEDDNQDDSTMHLSSAKRRRTGHA
ncbi:hypothetical protein BMF94_0606 [Rhodotorula taiwanensis]|uniref:BZIP domain-containing protein n=1 Tax=Rhodotorula taiwanensis TaxID=741276 RepID=A0A2S5BI03_9BASI|nr:hypothetical protein BMF94_0606 [Rhodotorula taiwanensis]